MRASSGQATLMLLLSCHAAQSQQPGDTRTLLAYPSSKRWLSKRMSVRLWEQGKKSEKHPSKKHLKYILILERHCRGKMLFLLTTVLFEEIILYTPAICCVALE